MSAERYAKHHTPAPWRDLSDRAVVQEVADTLFDRGNAVAISARLSHDVEAKALAQPKPTITWLQDRIALELRSLHRAGKLSTPPEFMLILEQVNGRDTHLHGFIGAVDVDLAKIRKAFRRACGEWATTEPRQHQVKTDAAPDDGWTSYMLKDRNKLNANIRRLCLKPGNWQSITFKGNYYTITQGLRQKAKARYEADVASFNSHS